MTDHAINQLVADYTNPIADIIAAEHQDPEWLIEGLLLQGVIQCLAGLPNVGKSYITYTVGLALASGLGALGGIVKPGDPKRVIYFDQENAETDRNKYLTQCYWGLAKENGCEPDIALLHENFIPVAHLLGSPDWEDIAGAFIDRYAPRLCVYDTATPCFDFDNENDNSEATKAINAIRRLNRRTNPVATAVVLRHEKQVDNKDQQKGNRRQMRGAKAWLGSTDGTWFQVRLPGRPRKQGFLTRLEPDKTRAYGLQQPIYITPEWTREDKSGLWLHGSYVPNKEHKKKLAEEGEDDE